MCQSYFSWQYVLNILVLVLLQAIDLEYHLLDFKFGHVKLQVFELVLGM